MAALRARTARPGPSALCCYAEDSPVLPVEHHLVGRVVAMLLGVEPAPFRITKVRNFGAENATRRRVTVRYVGSGDLVVALVLSEAAEGGVDGRRRVPALCQPANGLVCR